MRQRILTALVGIPIALAAILANSCWPVGVICLALYAIGSLELTRIYTGKGGGYLAPSPGFLASVAAIAMLSDPRIVQFGIGGLWVLLVAGVSGMALLAKGARKLPYRILASFYLFAGLVACVLLQRWGALGTSSLFRPNLLLMAVVPLWAGDSAAIFVGQAIGKHPMAPSISPGKTWEGGIANLLFSVLAAAGLGLWLGLPWWKGIAVGALVGTLGQVGDLLESQLKRSSGLKDSGSILPGHGGVLDRIDSLLLTSLPVATVLLLL